MTITLAGALLATISVIAFASLVQTFVRYGARVSRLARELGDCRDFVELRVVQHASTVSLVQPAPRIALRPAQTSIPVALRAAA